MNDKDTSRKKNDEQSALEDRSKRADAGAAPEQADRSPDKTPTDQGKPPAGQDKKPNENNDDELVDPREKRQDPPMPDRPKKIRVDQ